MKTSIQGPLLTRQGSEIVMLGFAAGSDGDSIWAKRESDGAVRCYYLYDVLLPAGVQSLSYYTCEVLDKEAAIAKAGGAQGALSPKRGVEFLHRRLLDPSDNGKQARCIVTAVREGIVYYCYSDRSGGRESCTVERWASIAAPLQ